MKSRNPAVLIVISAYHRQNPSEMVRHEACHSSPAYLEKRLVHGKRRNHSLYPSDGARVVVMVVVGGGGQ
jgi:hypothetical protein